MPFRDAYRKIGLAIEEDNFNYNTAINHTHEGSIGNLGTAQDTWHDASGPAGF